MSKDLIKELYLALDFLIEAGYFDEAAPKSKKTPLMRAPRGPDSKHRQKGKKLFPSEVMDIYKERRLSAQDLADLFDVTTGTIYDIKSGKTWSLLTKHKR